MHFTPFFWLILAMKMKVMVVVIVIVLVAIVVVVVVEVICGHFKALRLLWIILGINRCLFY